MKKYLYTATILLILLGIGLWGYRVMASSSVGPNGAGTGANDSSFGTVVWNNPSNITTDDSSYATANIVANGGNQDTEYLKATNFGFSIPTGATINGILFEAEAKQTTVSGILDAHIVKGGSIGTTDLNSGFLNQVNTTESFHSIPSTGASTQLWGETWTSSDINASNFGVVIWESFGNVTSTLSVNYIRATVYYTTASGVHASVTNTSGAMVIKGNVIIK